jgi:plasmid replication initiation protein
MTLLSESTEQLSPAREVYRDELNFAEFPLASISTSLPKDQKTLEFTDEIFDKSANKPVIRKLTITASDKYGLPTAMDDEVILGLIQLTGKRDFSDRRVFFTRYELLKLLNWKDTTRNYRRLEQSLNRWLGVTLYYEKAWWSKEEQSWVSEGFHILDHVQIFDQERQRKASKRSVEEAGKSSFVWNDVVFNSFSAGYIKQIDFEFYKSLESAISKRMYRFLDKRFYRRARYEFKLRTFACEHVGLSKSYHNGEIKRVLTPAIEELANLGFIESSSLEDRFIRKARGEWSVIFTRATEQIAKQQDHSPLLQALVERGLNTVSARRIVAKVESVKIQEKLALFDWLVSRNDLRIQRNRAGFLYRSITEDFPLPDDYRAAIASKVKASQRKVVSLQAHTAQSPPPIATDRTRIDEFWQSIPHDEKHRIEAELVKTAPPFLRQQYVEGQKGRGLLFQTVRQAIIDDYVRTKLA